jgi:brefeldin A-resistance guanine nucleotide exchange factor 1
MTFDYLTQLLTNQRESVTADNYIGIIMLLDEVALVASVVAETHAQQRRREPLLTASMSPIIERGLKAINMLYDLKDAMSRMLQQPELQRESSQFANEYAALTY